MVRDDSINRFICHLIVDHLPFQPAYGYSNDFIVEEAVTSTIFEFAEIN